MYCVMAKLSWCSVVLLAKPVLSVLLLCPLLDSC